MNMLPPTGIITPVRVNELIPRECFCMVCAQRLNLFGMRAVLCSYLRLIIHCVIFYQDSSITFYTFKSFLRNLIHRMFFGLWLYSQLKFWDKWYASLHQGKDKPLQNYCFDKESTEPIDWSWCQTEVTMIFLDVKIKRYLCLRFLIIITNNI